jgi:TM2 domain-containing membrane protein YozV
MTLPENYGDDPDEGAAPQEPEVSKRSRGLALVLSVFGGWFGLDRFYVGKVGTAIPKLCTFGGMGIWWLYDVILIATGEFRDSEDLPLRQWEVSPSPFGQHRLGGRAEQRVNELEEQLDGLRQQFNDLAERVDFAERMLAQKREPPRPQLPRGS